MKKNYSTPSVTIYKVETENLMVNISQGGVQDNGDGASVGVGQAGTMGSGDVDASQYRSGLWN